MNSRKVFLILALGGLGIALAVGLALYFKDTEAPVVTLTPASGPVGPTAPFTLAVDDPGSGLRALTVTVTQQGKTATAAQFSFAQPQNHAEASFTLEQHGLSEGPLTIQVTASDASIRGFGQGNVLTASFNFTLDTRPPVISVLSTAHNVNRGGSGLAAYTLNEEARESGVAVGAHFFPGFKQPSGTYLCLFAFPYNMEASDFRPQVRATDLAGNTRTSGFIFHPIERWKFKSDVLALPQSFLDTKMPEFEPLVPHAADQLERFVKVNTEIREANAQEFYALRTKTSPTPLWSGTFLRMPNTAPRAGFADARTYTFDGRDVSRSVHLGLDLASTMADEVPAAADGKVLKAGYVGIYGNTVVLDHGLGLMSLYSHLSSILVEEGQMVFRGNPVGRTGTTGLAGGDHLHFGIMVSGLPVQPIEWWDPHWIKDNLDEKLTLAKAAPAK
ncbi:MAG: M23 family metallopeptidase [Thermodesulfobacteriota bacterium]